MARKPPRTDVPCGVGSGQVTMQAELRRLSDDGCVCAQPNRIFGWWTVRLRFKLPIPPRFSSSEALMLGWFRALMPKEERFFDLFTRHAQVTLAAAHALRALLKGDDDVLRCCREITRLENEADEITREVMTALRKTFITPLDRGDIKDLITSMDDSIDQMNQTAKDITLFELRSFEGHMQEMGDIIVQAAQLMMDAVPLLSSLGRHSARLNSLTEEMIRLEEQADQLHDQGRKQLFLNEKDAIAFVIGTEVYEHLETVVDRFEDVANEISAIVIENV